MAIARVAELALATYACDSLRAERRAVGAEVFLTSVAQPDPQHLRDLLAFFRSEGLVKKQRPFPLAATRAIVVRVPMAPCEADAPTGLFDQRLTRQGFQWFLFRGHMGQLLADVPAHTITRRARTTVCVTTDEIYYRKARALGGLVLLRDFQVH